MMLRFAHLSLTITVLISGTHTLRAEPSPNEILAKVAATYASMKTYKAQGTITRTLDTAERKFESETSFSIILKKPNMYLITWSLKTSGIPYVQSGAVWNQGPQPYLYMGMMKAYSKMTSDGIALSAATGISRGAAFTIPSIFLQVFTNLPAPFPSLRNPQLEKSEEIEGEDCFVVSGPSETSKRVTYWISKSSYLIRRIRNSREPPEGGRVVREDATDEELEESIKDLGLTVTEERKKNMKENMRRVNTMLKNMKLSGYSTELHAIVSSPELNPSDFKFALPEGTVLKDSLFGDVLDGNIEFSDKGMNRNQQ